MRIPLPERLERLARWFRCENERPLLGFSLGSYYPLKRYARAAAALPDGLIAPEDIRVSEFLEDTERLYVLHEQAGGDLLFSAAPFWGVPWVEAALGCGVRADRQAGSMRAVRPPAFHCIPSFSERGAWFAKMLEFIPALHAQSAGRYPVGLTLMRGVSDLLAAVYGAEDFVLRLHDDPAGMRSVIDALAEFWIEFARCLLRHLESFHGGTGAFLYGAWIPGETVWLQEDAVALLSPKLYREFILPADARIAAAFEHTAVHLHPTRFMPYRELIGAGVDVIEMHIDHDGPRAEALMPHYRAVLESRPLLVWGDVTEEDLYVLRGLPHRGLAICAVVEGMEDAARYER